MNVGCDRQQPRAGAGEAADEFTSAQFRPGQVAEFVFIPTTLFGLFVQSVLQSVGQSVGLECFFF